jgi:hypothetical protein
LEENRDLFMQLDIEKAKFDQVAKVKNIDAQDLLAMN